MKLHKNASGNSVLKMTKKEWLAMGKEAGWSDEQHMWHTQKTNREVFISRLEKLCTNLGRNYIQDSWEAKRLASDASKIREEDLANSLNKFSDSLKALSLEHQEIEQVAEKSGLWAEWDKLNPGTYPTPEEKKNNERHI